MTEKTTKKAAKPQRPVLTGDEVDSEAVSVMLDSVLEKGIVVDGDTKRTALKKPVAAVIWHPNRPGQRVLYVRFQLAANLNSPRWWPVALIKPQMIGDLDVDVIRPWRGDVSPAMEYALESKTVAEFNTPRLQGVINSGDTDETDEITKRVEVVKLDGVVVTERKRRRSLRVRYRGYWFGGGAVTSASRMDRGRHERNHANVGGIV